MKSRKYIRAQINYKKIAAPIQETALKYDMQTRVDLFVYVIIKRNNNNKRDIYLVPVTNTHTHMLCRIS